MDQQLINDVIAPRSTILGQLSPETCPAMPLTKDVMLAVMQESALSFYYQSTTRTRETVQTVARRYGAELVYDEMAVMPRRDMTIASCTNHMDPVMAHACVTAVCPDLAPSLYGAVAGADSSHFMFQYLYNGTMISSTDEAEKHNPKLPTAYVLFMECMSYADSYVYKCDRKPLIKIWRKIVKQKGAGDYGLLNVGIRLIAKICNAAKTLSNEHGIVFCMNHMAIQVDQRGKARMVIPYHSMRLEERNGAPSPLMMHVSIDKSHSVFFNEWIDHFHNRCYVTYNAPLYLGDDNAHMKYNLNHTRKSVVDNNKLRDAVQYMKAMSNSDYGRIDNNTKDEQFLQRLRDNPNCFQERVKLLLQLAVKF